jgi:hypothetical protein
MITNFFTPLLFLFLDSGSGMGKNQDPGSGINIPDPKHWCCGNALVSNADPDPGQPKISAGPDPQHCF